MGSFCTTKQQTQAQTSNSGTSDTTNKLFNDPRLQGFLQSYSNQYGDIGNLNVGPNQWQTQAANNQTSVPGQYGSLFNQASQIGQNGITTADINKYMSPYVQQVVDPTVEAFKNLNAATTSDVNGSLAKNGALGNSNNAATRANVLAPIQNQQKAQIAGLYNTGYGQAQNTAAANVQAQLGGLNSGQGALAGTTGANTGLGNLGQNIWGSQYSAALAPYSLYNQGVQGFTGLGNLAGSTVNTTGQGTSNSVTGQTPSPFQVGMSIAGLGTAFLADGGRVHAPQTKFASGGLVGGDAPSFADKVGHAFETFHAMRKKAQGGGITDRNGFDDGGWVTSMGAPLGGPPSSNDAYWDNIQAQAMANPNGGQPSFGDKFGTGLNSMSKATAGDPKAAADANASALRGLGQTQDAMARSMQQALAPPRIGYADGGMPDQWDATGSGPSEGSAPPPMRLGAEPPPPSASSQGASFSGLGDFLRGTLRGSAWDIQGRPTPMNNFSRSAMAASGPLLLGSMATQLGEMEKERAARYMADLHYAQLAGQLPNGQQTLAGQEFSATQARNARLDPVNMAHTQSQTHLAEIEAMAKDPRVAAAKVALMQAIDRGEEITPALVNQLYGQFGVAPTQAAAKVISTGPSAMPNPGSEGAPGPQAAAVGKSPAQIAAERVQSTVLAQNTDPQTASRNWQALLNDQETGPVIADYLAKTGTSVPPGDWKTAAQTFVNGTRANPTGPVQRNYPAASVPQGGDPTAAVTRPNASEPSKVNRPYQADEDTRLQYKHMLAPELRTTLENTPGHKGRVKEEELRAADRIDTEKRQTQGRELERQLNELHDKMVSVGPDVVNYATGPYLSDPTWQKRLALVPFANGRGSTLEQAQMLNTKVQHTIDAIATQMGALQGGSKGATDAARDELKRAVGEGFKSRGPEGVFEVLHDAKRNIQGLARLPIDPVRKDYYPDEWRRQGIQPQAGVPTGTVPAPDAIRQQLRSLPDGVHDTPGGRIIKSGNTITPVQGELGTRGNPLSSQTEVQKPGQIAYEGGKYWRRTPNYFTDRWEEVQ